MTVTLNGSAAELADGSTVLDALELLKRSAESRGIAVAVNGEVVPRAAWGQVPLGDGDRIEVLTAVAGG